MSNLKEKSIDAIAWSLAERYGLQVFSLIIGVILARLLTPADYGLIGMINVLFLLASVFVKSGLGKAYIQKKDATEIDASTIFFFNITVSLLFYTIFWFSAPSIAKFYNHELLVDLIRVASIVLIINAFSMMQVSKLTKEVNFKKKSIISLVSTVIAGMIGIATALLNFGVWSLVFQQIASAIISAVGLWVFYKWRPLIRFDMNSLKSMFSFSAWILLSSIVRTIFDNIYILTIGKFFPVAELGFYTKAKGYQKMVTQQPSSAISVVSFPFFSKIQDDKNGLKQGMKKFISHTLFFIMPVAAILIVVAEPLISIVLTEKWLPMVPYFQLLLVIGALYPIHLLNLVLLNAQGKANLNFRLIMVTNVLRIINIYITYRFGVIYIVFGELIISFLSLFINGYYTKKMINYSVFEQLLDVSKIILFSIGVVVAGTFLSQIFLNDYLKLISGTLAGITVYLGANYLLNKQFFLAIIDLVKSKFIKS